jgi:2-C-methyl-D-erythritol 2,4-cyclodiphosphate synthase
LLERVLSTLEEKGYRVGNVDATVLAEQPRMRDYIYNMRQKLSQALRTDISQVSVKASTSAKLGSVGRGEGIAAYAIAVIEGSKDEGI